MFLDKGLTITEIEDLLDVDQTTIWRIKKRFLDFGLEKGLNGRCQVRAACKIYYVA